MHQSGGGGVCEAGTVVNNPEAFARRGEDKLVVMASNVRERERERRS